MAPNLRKGLVFFVPGKLDFSRRRARARARRRCFRWLKLARRGAHSKLLKDLVRKLNQVNFRTKISSKKFYFVGHFRRNLPNPYSQFARHRLGPGNELIPFVCARSSLRSAQATQRTRLNLIKLKNTAVYVTSSCFELYCSHLLTKIVRKINRKAP